MFNIPFCSKISLLQKTFEVFLMIFPVRGATAPESTHYLGTYMKFGS